MPSFKRIEVEDIPEDVSSAKVTFTPKLFKSLSKDPVKTRTARGELILNYALTRASCATTSVAVTF